MNNLLINISKNAMKQKISQNLSFIDNTVNTIVEKSKEDAKNGLWSSKNYFDLMDIDIIDEIRRRLQNTGYYNLVDICYNNQNGKSEITPMWRIINY